MKPKELYQKAIEKWGADAQFDMAVEECAELIAAMNRWRRNRIFTAQFIEECVDVEIMLEQIRIVLTKDPDLKQIFKLKRTEKLKRLEERLNE